MKKAHNYVLTFYLSITKNIFFSIEWLQLKIIFYLEFLWIPYTTMITVKFELIDFLLSRKGFRLREWNFQGWVYRLKYIPGRYFELPTSTLSPSRGPWPLMNFTNMCVTKVKLCKIDLLLNWSTTKLFSAS